MAHECPVPGKGEFTPSPPPGEKRFVAGLCLSGLLLINLACGGKPTLVGFWRFTDKSGVIVFEESGVAERPVNGILVPVGTWSADGETLTVSAKADDGSTHKVSARINWVNDRQLELTDFQGYQPESGSSVSMRKLTASEQAAALRREPEQVRSPFDPPSPPSQDQRFAQTCLGNVRQLAMATLLYAQDYDSDLPIAGDWEHGIFGYTKTADVFTCPSVAKDGREGGYSFNVGLAGTSLHMLPAPGAIPMIFESLDLSPGSTLGPEALPKLPRHNGVNSVSFADGHAKSVPAGSPP